MNSLAKLFGIRESSAPAFQCIAPQCRSTDLLIVRDIEQLVPDAQCPRRIVVGFCVVCCRCGQPCAVTREGVYHPALSMAGASRGADISPERRGNAEPAKAHPRWSGREP